MRKNRTRTCRYPAPGQLQVRHYYVCPQEFAQPPSPTPIKRNGKLFFQRCVTVLLHIKRCNTKMASFSTVYDSLSFVNVVLVLLLLVLLHYLSLLYEFRSMPPGPRFTAIPVLGNAFSLDFNAERLTDAFKRSVDCFCTAPVML